MFDYRNLREKIRVMYRTEAEFTKLINMVPSTFSAKINGNSEFRQDEIMKICEVLKIKPKEIPHYFFCLKSSEN